MKMTLPPGDACYFVFDGSVAWFFFVCFRTRGSVARLTCLLNILTAMWNTNTWKMYLINRLWKWETRQCITIVDNEILVKKLRTGEAKRNLTNVTIERCSNRWPIFTGARTRYHHLEGHHENNSSQWLIGWPSCCGLRLCLQGRRRNASFSCSLICSVYSFNFPMQEPQWKSDFPTPPLLSDKEICGS